MKKPNLKKSAILLAALAFIVAAVFVITPYTLDAPAIKQRLEAAAKQGYNLTLTTGQDSIVTAFPSPAVTYSNVKLMSNTERLIAEMPTLSVKIGWLGLFNQSINSLELNEPTIKLTPQNKKALLDAFANSSQTPPLLASTYAIHNARMQIIAPENESAPAYLKNGLTISQLNLLISPAQAGPLHIEGAFDWKEKRLRFSSNYQAASKALTGSVTADELLKIQFDGKLSDTPNQEFMGKLNVDIADSLTLSRWLSGYIATVNVENKETLPAYPLSFSAKASLDKDRLLIHRSNATFQQEQAQVALFVGWSNYLNIAMELAAKSLKADQFITAFSEHLLPDNTLPQSYLAPIVVDPLPDYVDIHTLLKVDQVELGSKTYANLNLAAELANSNVIIHHANMDMAGESTIVIDGVIEQLPEGRRFNGFAQISGERFNEWLANFEPAASHLPSKDFSNFDFAGNLFISKQQLRLSEAQLQIGELGFQGGFATFFDQMPRVEAEVRLQDINLDYLRDIWRDAESKTDQATSLGVDRDSLEWLRRLPAILDFRITIDKFTFLDTMGKTATTRLYAKPGELLLSGLEMRMVNNVLNSNIRLNVMNEKPELSVALTASTLNTDYFKQQVDTESPPYFNRDNPANRWSEELWDFDIINQLNGTLDLSIGNFIHNGESYQNFKCSAELVEQSLNIKNLTFALLDGTFNLNGTLTGGSVPGISASFALYNATLDTILSTFFGNDTITGRVSLSGVVGTSGIHPKAWLENGEMKISAAARGVRVQNFNLQGMIDAVKQARSTVDVKTAANELLFDGLTEISVDGNVNINNGVMRTPGFKLSYGRTLGNFQGEVRLIEWTLNLTSFWQFPELSSSTVPTMNISVQGPIQETQTRVDTSSLEAFVAKRIVGQ